MPAKNSCQIQTLQHQNELNHYPSHLSNDRPDMSSSLQPRIHNQQGSNSNTSGFDPHDEDSWFFGPMSRDDATQLLSKNNEVGAFLVRESTTAKLDLVLTVKEGNEKVSHYIINRFIPDKGIQVCFRIGEQVFRDLPSLLTFYKANYLDDTPLKVPAQPKEISLNKSFTNDYLPEVLKDGQSRLNKQLVVVQSQSIENNQRSACLPLTQRKVPCYAKVVQSRTPNAYDKTALTLREGDIVKVTKVDINGCWEGELNGRSGHFPFNYVRFLDDNSGVSE